MTELPFWGRWNQYTRTLGVNENDSHSCLDRFPVGGREPIGSYNGERTLIQLIKTEYVVKLRGIYAFSRPVVTRV